MQIFKNFMWKYSSFARNKTHSYLLSFDVLWPRIRRKEERHNTYSSLSYNTNWCVHGQNWACMRTYLESSGIYTRPPALCTDVPKQSIAMKGCQVVCRSLQRLFPLQCSLLPKCSFSSVACRSCWLNCALCRDVLVVGVVVDFRFPCASSVLVYHQL